jgi:23S rRNA pseudouridine2605 synthase
MRQKRPQRKLPPPDPYARQKGERIAKVMARAGLCSRREAEAWIAQGRVAVNGTILSTPALSIAPDDKVSVDGKPLAQRQRTRLFLFHKPRGLVTTNRDPQGRPTIFDYLAAHHTEAPRLVSVGRLDVNTEGLILLTNDGGLARVLELPATGWLRRYRVRAKGEIDQASLDRLANGVTIDGIHYAGIEATLDRTQGANCWLTMGLREGKNREIKRVLEHLGLTVNRLIRLSFGPFQLGDLTDGALEEVRTRVLRDQLGATLLQQSGADLVAPIDSSRDEPGSDRTADFAPVQRRGTRPRPRDAEPEPAPKKPRGRPMPGPRKHVSALRAEARNQKDKSGVPRRHRVERGETEDRKGRVVAIERHLGTAASPQKKPTGVRKPSRFAAKPLDRTGKRGAGSKRRPHKAR